MKRRAYALASALLLALSVPAVAQPACAPAEALIEYLTGQGATVMPLDEAGRAKASAVYASTPPASPILLFPVVLYITMGATGPAILMLGEADCLNRKLDIPAQYRADFEANVIGRAL